MSACGKSLIGKITEQNEVVIHVQHGSEITAIQTDSSSSILSVQQQIEETWGIPLQQQRLHLTVFCERQNTKNNGFTLKRFANLGLLCPPNSPPSPELERMLVDTKQRIDISARQENREEEARQMNEMVLAAKTGQYDKAFDVVKARKHLLNGIPEKRHWSALHQVVFSRDAKVVERFLSFDNCDVHVHAKPDPVLKHGETPAELAKLCNCNEIEELVLVRGQNILTDVPACLALDAAESISKYGFPILNLASAFMPKEMLHELDGLHCDSFLALTESVVLVGQKYFKSLQKSVADALYLYSQDLYHMLFSETNYEEFESALVRVFSHDHVYAKVNEGLKRSAEQFTPTAEELFLCLYALLLEATLLHLANVRSYQGISYRGGTLNADQIAQYKKSQKVMWVSITSSSKSAAAAFKGNVKFIIDNQCLSKWTPKEFDSLSLVNTDLELLHPAGSMFQVIDTTEKKGIVEIKLKLIN